VTAIELMPVQAFFDDRHLVEQGLSNYWGYNTVGFFAPATQYISPEGGLHEFKLMVRKLHEARIEVILDVVYNHSAEGNETGPTLSFRGIDNSNYYILRDDPRYYFDATGCGNTLNLRHPRVLQMVMDSLRYWVECCHVDGFRFDLATALGRERDVFDPAAVFFDTVRQDPVLSRVKLIAEPWDVGPDGYRLGQFPPGWAEWNDAYRDSLRSFWRGDDGSTPELAKSLLGSAELFDRRGRRSWASINYVTAHDGFTLIDLFSYDQKYNEENKEDNRDGHDDNRSWNCGAEGPTDDPEVISLRERMRRNAIATLLLSQGTPMLLMGDEVGRTQHGNNNAYCQDNEVSWVEWKLSKHQLRS
jgi:isoamylase